MNIIYRDADMVVCVKPARILSTDEPGGLPELLRQALGVSDVRTVHRLDRVVSGLMVLALNARAASELSRQIRENQFQKEYMAVVHGKPAQEGRLTDLLLRDKARKMTLVTDMPKKGALESSLTYQRQAAVEDYSKLHIQLETGRTHQIRVQFSSRGFPLVGERKYAVLEDECEIALWSYRLAFRHPTTGAPVEFTLEPPEAYPWNLFKRS